MDAPKLNFNQKMTILVDLFIKKESSINWVAADYGRERGALKRLLTKYPEFDFFYTLNELFGRFNSLCGLMKGQYHNLDKLYSDYTIDKSKRVSYTLESSPVIVIEEPKKVYKNVMDFLDN